MEGWPVVYLHCTKTQLLLSVNLTKNSELIARYRAWGCWRKRSGRTCNSVEIATVACVVLNPGQTSDCPSCQFYKRSDTVFITLRHEGNIGRVSCIPGFKRTILEAVLCVLCGVLSLQVYNASVVCLTALSVVNSFSDPPKPRAEAEESSSCLSNRISRLVCILRNFGRIWHKAVVWREPPSLEN